MTLSIKWKHKPFQQLSVDELYDALKLRIDVFVVEQTCYYPDLDNNDRHPETIHLLGYDGDTLVAYLRILPPGVSYPEYTSIGRVATLKNYRGQGIGHPLIIKAIELSQKHWPNINIKISAQQHLEKYYQQHNFKTVTEMYLEDNIPHIGMVRTTNE